MEKTTKGGMIVVAACVAAQVGIVVYANKKMLGMTTGIASIDKRLNDQNTLWNAVKKSFTNK